MAAEPKEEETDRLSPGETVGGCLLLLSLLFVGPWVHEATWPIWLILALATAAWAYCFVHQWLRGVADAVLKPVVWASLLLCGVLIAFNLVGLRMGEERLRAVERVLVETHFWLKGLGHPNLLALIAVLCVALMVVRWGTRKSGTRWGAHAVTRTLAVRDVLAAVSMFLLTLTSFTLFAAVPLGDRVEAEHERRVEEWQAGQHQLELLRREERDAVAEYLAVQVVEEAAEVAMEEDLSELARALLAIDEEIESSLEGYPPDFHVQVHNIRARKAHSDALLMRDRNSLTPPIRSDFLPAGTAAQHRRSLWSSAVEGGWLEPMKGALEPVLAAVGEPPSPPTATRDELRRLTSELDKLRRRQEKREQGLGPHPESAKKYREQRQRVEGLSQQVAEETQRIERLERQAAEARAAVKATLLAALTAAVPIPESLAGRFAEALVEATAEPIAERWAGEGAERARRLGVIESDVKSRTAEAPRIERLVVPAALVEAPSGFRRDLRSSFRGADGEVRPLAADFAKTRARLAEVERRLEPVRARLRQTAKGRGGRSTTGGRGRP